MTTKTGVKQGDIPFSRPHPTIPMIVGWTKLFEGVVLCMKHMDSKKFGNHRGFYRLTTSKAEKEGLMAADRDRQREEQ